MTGKEICETVEEAKYIKDILDEKVTQKSADAQVVLPYNAIKRMIGVCDKLVDVVYGTNFKT